MLKIKRLLMLLLIAVLILIVYFGISDGVIEDKAIELSPVISLNESDANTDAVFQADLSTSDKAQGLTVSNSREDEHLLRVQHLLDKGLDLSPFNENEILLLRKYNNNDKEVPDEEIPAWFRVFVQIVFLQSGEKNPQSMLSEKVDNNWVGANASNQDIQHWENISADGDVIATGVLAGFYRDTWKWSKAEYYFQKLIVNVTDKTSPLDDLINISYMQNKRKSAAYAWYGRNNDIDLNTYGSGKRFHELINTYSEQQIATELEEVNSLFEDLQVNYSNPELTELKDIFN
jgi:hypothetical protein